MIDAVVSYRLGEEACAESGYSFGTAAIKVRRKRPEADKNYAPSESKIGQSTTLKTWVQVG